MREAHHPTYPTSDSTNGAGAQDVKRSAVAVVLLHHDVGSELGDSEDRVRTLVDRATLGNPELPIVRGVEFPALVELDQRQAVRHVAIDLVGRREEKRASGQ